MIDLETYKKSLGKVADKLPEEEILKIRKIQDDLAEIFFPLWLETVKNKNSSIINKQHA